MSLMATFTMCSDTEDRDHPLESDYYATAFIPKKVQAFDKGLYDTKWFDYRFMTPLGATKEYMRVYGEVYRTIYARNIDRARAEYLHPISFHKVKPGLERGDQKARRQFTGCWRGRQFADAIGMPYKTYLEWMFHFRMRAWQQSTMPQPQQLYHEIDLERTQEKWEELQEADLWLAEHPAYLVQNYEGTPAQNAYHEWLFKQAGLRSNVPEFLAQFVHNDQLPADKVYARLEDEWMIERFEYYLDHS